MNWKSVDCKMSLLKNNLYRFDIEMVANNNVPWEKLNNQSVLISGATGMVGSFLVDVLMYRNSAFDMNCHIYALGRNTCKARERFASYWKNPLFEFIAHDISEQFSSDSMPAFNWFLHLASNTHPLQYANDPIGTITTNVIGLKNILDLAAVSPCKRVLFASSNEIYGENRGDTELFSENYCGYIDCNTLRAGYPESKRCGEALCQAYMRQKNLDIVVARLTRSYGPSMLMTDSKASSQFLKKGIAGEDIVLKSAGLQYYSYTYVADAVSGLLYTLLAGKTGEAYNIADESGDIHLKDMAEIIAGNCGTKVVYEIPDSTEASGYSTATKARLNGAKLKSLGWHPLYTIQEGVKRTIDILKSQGDQVE